MGPRSQLRQRAGIRTDGWQYWQSCLVATIASEKYHNHIAYECFWPSGPFAILPVSEHHCRIVWTAPHAEAQALLALDDEQFIQALMPRYGHQMGKLAVVGQRFVFPAKWMQSRRYSGQRLALVGDAAHTCHPVGGQGLKSRHSRCSSAGANSDCGPSGGRRYWPRTGAQALSPLAMASKFVGTRVYRLAQPDVFDPMGSAGVGPAARLTSNAEHFASAVLDVAVYGGTDGAAMTTSLPVSSVQAP